MEFFAKTWTVANVFNSHGVLGDSTPTQHYPSNRKDDVRSLGVVGKKVSSSSETRETEFGNGDLNTSSLQHLLAHSRTRHECSSQKNWSNNV